MSPIRAALQMLVVSSTVVGANAADRPKPQPRVVPLGEICTTFDSPQGGPEFVGPTVKSEGNERGTVGQAELDSLSRIVSQYRSGGPDVFLVVGTSLNDALRSSHTALCECEDKKRPVLMYENQPDKAGLWLCAHLSTENPRAQWSVQSVHQDGRVIRLTFTCSPFEGQVEAVSHQYFVWAPLPKLEPGKYTLELYDAGEKDVVMTRRVTIEGK